MWELIKAGGWVMWPIMACAVLSLAIILERFWTLRRREIAPATLGDEVRAWAASGKLRITIDREYDLADAGQAHTDLAGRKTSGKLLLVL